MAVALRGEHGCTIAGRDFVLRPSLLVLAALDGRIQGGMRAWIDREPKFSEAVLVFRALAETGPRPSPAEALALEAWWADLHWMVFADLCREISAALKVGLPNEAAPGTTALPAPDLPPA